MERENLIGKRFGRWTVIGEAEPHVTPKGFKRTFWHCKCDCGTERDVSGCSLRNGDSKSCGCYHSDIMHDVGKVNKTHDMSNTRLYRIYKHMLCRCYNANDNRYDNYGGRGIKVCDEWQTFEAFAKWANENGYSDDLSIDRIDVNQDYKPSNCRWADVKTQNNNKTSCRYYTINGETHNIAEWASIYDVPYKRVWKRLKYGWDIERALTAPNTF